MEAHFPNARWRTTWLEDEKRRKKLDQGQYYNWRTKGTNRRRLTAEEDCNGVADTNEAREDECRKLLSLIKEKMIHHEKKEAVNGLLTTINWEGPHPTHR